MRKLQDVFKHYEGQPVLVYTDDGRKHVGIDLNAFEDAVRILDKCNRLEIISYRHIDSVVEPQMRLECHCKDKCHDRDRDRENGNGRDRDENGRDYDRDYCEENGDFEEFSGRK